MAGRTLRNYQIINVFAEQPFSGKTVAVFPDATGMSVETMGAVARELGFPRTAFVFPSSTGDAQAKVRVFAPGAELSGPGLPTIATVFVLQGGADSRGPAPAPRVVVEQDEAPVSVAYAARVYSVRQELPTFGRVYPERETVAALLSLRPDELADGPVQVVSSGLPYLLVPVKNSSSITRIKLRESIWERTLLHFDTPHVLAFATKPIAPGQAAHVRAFTPAIGVPEEPASEEASGPLLAYMLRYQMGSVAQGNHAVLSQGVEMGRPSVLHVSYHHEDSALVDLRVGGPCIAIGSGTILA